MFSWCKTCSTEPIGSGYLVQKEKEPPKFYSKFADIKETDLRDLKTSVIKINKSEYDAFSQSLTGKESKFVDQDFPPTDKSLGYFQNVKTDKWKRINDIVQNSTYFSKDAGPADAVASNHKYNFGYQAAVAAISERPERLKVLFSNPVINPSGIYTFLLRVNGKVEEVIIDDYIPVDQNGDPIFSKPHENSIWVLLLEKARAKLHGSYEKMIKESQNARNPLQQITFAPTDVYKNAGVNKDDLWNKIVEATQRGYIQIGLSSKSEKINWGSINLSPSHFYTILDAGSLTHKLGSVFKVIKLRNAFKQEDYKGEGSLTDTLFWDQIENSDAKSRLLSSDGPKEGVIYMLYSDYLKYFDQTIINYYQAVRNYSHELCEFTSSNGLVYEFNIIKEGFYSFVVDQSRMQPQQKGIEYVEEGWSRATVLLIRNGTTINQESYQYISGLLKYNEQYAHLRASIAPGKYILYVKLDPTIKNQNFPSQINIVSFSSQNIQLRQSLQQNYPSLLKKMFLDHARWHKRQLYNNDLMWSSWKLITQGGYAYIAFGNSSESKSKFVISFKEDIFNKQNYILKKPFKGKGEQTLEVLPGQEEIILLRIKNSEIKQINFPPPIDLQIQPI